MKPPKAGELRYKITIQQATMSVSTITGQRTKSWAGVRTTRAKREYASGGSGEGIEEDLQVVGTQKVIYTIRKLNSEFNTKDYRVKDGGNTYDVQEVAPMGYGQEMFLKLVCVETNNFN